MLSHLDNEAASETVAAFEVSTWLSLQLKSQAVFL